MSSYHTPVLVQETIDGLGVTRGNQYIDATLGGGGHAWEIVKRGGILLGIDADRDAIAEAHRRLSFECKEVGIKSTFTLVHGNFRHIKRIADEYGFREVSGILMDLGVSSFQLDTADKGFSYRYPESFFDLRLDTDTPVTAAECVRQASEEELYEILTRFGEEERARAIAHALVRSRQIKTIQTVGDVLKSIEACVGEKNPEKFAVYSRVFQAFRIQVNDELGALRDALEQTPSVLQSGGRLAVISFHSLEDRIVKQYMRGPGWKRVTKKPLIAGDEENDMNRRSRSAKLRIAEKL